jgi:hypothetical protein
MSDAFIVFVIIAGLCTSFTVGVVSFTWLTHRVLTAWVRHLDQQTAIRRFEAESRLEQARLQAHLPVWIDRTDPAEVAAWNRAVAETWRVSTTRELARATG